MASSPAGEAAVLETGVSQVLDYLHQATQIVQTFVQNTGAVPTAEQEEEVKAEPAAAESFMAL